MIHLHVKFHIPSYNSSLIIAFKQKSKWIPCSRHYVHTLQKASLESHVFFTEFRGNTSSDASASRNTEVRTAGFVFPKRYTQTVT